MSGPAETNPAAPSVFLSYASENRAAVRQLRDALLAAGIEAWYDENELTGGEAWDQKIRRQIRDCTYFMPVISAESNARLEGYFRREWRLAIERSLDMADDVVFLLPVAIDETPGPGARVPEKFQTVQWLRVPGGVPTPGFSELARRLAAGGAHRLHLAPAASRPTGATARPPQYLPPLHDDPGPPKEWWRWVPYFWAKLPRWVRFCGWCIILIGALQMCSRLTSDDRSDDSPRRRRPAETKTEDKPGDKTAGDPAPATPSIAGFDPKAVEQTVQQALQAAMAARAAKNAPQRPPDLDLLPFRGNENAQKIQRELFGKYIAVGGVRTRLSVAPLKGTPGDSTPVERGRADGTRFVLSCMRVRLGDGSEILRLKLERTADGNQLWTTDVKLDEDPPAAATRIFAETLPILLRKD